MSVLGGSKEGGVLFGEKDYKWFLRTINSINYLPSRMPKTTDRTGDTLRRVAYRPMQCLPTVSSEKEWLYLPPDGTAQKGPLPAKVLLHLYERTVLKKTTLVWRAGMSEWQGLHQAEPFKSYIEFYDYNWYYLDVLENNAQKGPIDTLKLIEKLKDGDIDAFTTIYCYSISDQWIKVSDVRVLKEVINQISVEEDVIAASSSVSYNDAQVIQEDNKEDQERIMSEFRSFAAGNMDCDFVDKKRECVVSKRAKKVFRADDGTKYYWDDQEGDWVVDERICNGDDEDEGGDDEGDDSNDDYEEKLSTHKNKDATNSKNNDTTVHNSNKRKRKKHKKGANNWVYITGLPLDLTIEELKAHFVKCGLIAISPLDQQPKIKIYKDEEGNNKGDASLCYNATESVDMCINVLDEGFIRPSFKIRISKAEFHVDKSGNNNSNKNGPALSQAQLKVARSAMRQAMAWSDNSGKAALRIVVLENCCTIQELEMKEGYDSVLEKVIFSSCSKFGDIDKITLFSKNPKGVIIVKFKTAFSAQACISAMDGSDLMGKKIRSYFWDGVTNFSASTCSITKSSKDVVTNEGTDECKVDVVIDEEEEEKRLEDFGNWLEENEDDLPEELRLRTE